ncbi:MAG: Iron-sulfur protein [Parcubacteria group bacterium GW2011_GWA2_47_7]|nr:MAG: Iron-sulfur protein [Parcubacteria group bacterium GW2011_GWA2_47_7]
MSETREYLRNKEGSNISKIVVDRDLCISAVSCIAVSEATFALDDESKVIATDPNAADDETLMAAAESCPTKAILLFDNDGKQVFPV